MPSDFISKFWSKIHFTPRFGAGTPVFQNGPNLRQNAGVLWVLNPSQKAAEPWSLFGIERSNQDHNSLHEFFRVSLFHRSKKSISWHITTEHLCISCSFIYIPPWRKVRNGLLIPKIEFAMHLAVGIAPWRVGSILEGWLWPFVTFVWSIFLSHLPWGICIGIIFVEATHSYRYYI